LEIASFPDYLASPKFISEAAEKDYEIGIAMGLAWTPSAAKFFLSKPPACPARGTHAHRPAR